jgi:hypothetical protein
MTWVSNVHTTPRISRRRAALAAAAVLSVLMAGAAPARATSERATILSPAAGSLSSSPQEPHHTPYGGDWSVDVAGAAGRPVHARFSNVSGSLGLSVVGTFEPCAYPNGGTGGSGVRVQVSVDGVVLGVVNYSHLSNARGVGPLNNGDQIGTMVAGKKTSCWTGPHVHMEPRNASKFACFQPIPLGSSLGAGTKLGVIGGEFAGAKNQACPAGAIDAEGGPAAGSPTGNVEWVGGAAGGFIQLGGWVMDPDAPRTPTSVHAYVDGPAGSGAPMAGLDAAMTRTDVAAAFPGASAEHGFSTAIGGIGPGEHTVYVYGINVAGGGENPLLRTVKVTVPHTQAGSPFGSFDAAEGRVGGVARVAGWTIDPDERLAATDVHAYVDGPAGSGARGIDLGRADGSRPDVPTVHPGSGDSHGFDKTIDGLAPGVHTLWIYAINRAGGGENPLIGVKSVSVPEGSPPPPPPPDASSPERTVPPPPDDVAPARCRMPNLVGARFQKVNSRLKKAGCGARFEVRRSRRCWFVRKQTPRKGKSIVATASARVWLRRARC